MRRQVLGGKSPVNVNEVLSALREPDALARPMPKWVWNGRLDADDLTGQLDDMLGQRIRGFVIHPMPQEFRPEDFGAGLELEYLGEPYFDVLKKVMAAAADRDMRVWLYDEGGWPSGVNCGRVVADRPDLKGKVARYNEEGEVEILERGFPVDLLNMEATATYIMQVHEAYAEAVGDHFGKTIVGFLTDEPLFAGRVGGAEIPWTPTLPDVFKARKGYDISLGLAILFGLKASRALDEQKRAMVICDFLDVVTDMWRENWWELIQVWCADRGLQLAGHLNGDDTLLGHLSGGGDFFRAMRAVDWPCVDATARQIDPASDADSPNDYPKFASSAAHVDGKDRVISQSFASSGWDITFDEMRWATNFQYVRGVNAISPSAFYSDARGPRKIGTMSDQYLTSPLFQHYGEYSDYVGRLGMLASLGEPVVETALYYPVRSVWFQSSTSIQNHLQTVSRGLLDLQIDFDYLGDDSLAAASVGDDGTFTVGKCTYGALLFPDTTTVSIEVMRLAKQVADGGGVVAFLGEKPRLACRAGDAAELAELLAALEVSAVSIGKGDDFDVALAMVPRTLRLGIDSAHVRVSRRTTGDAEIFLVVNESTDNEQSIRTKLPAEGPAYVYDMDSGAVVAAEISGGSLRLTLPPSSAKAILVGAGDVDVSDATDDARPSKTLAVDGPWRISMVRRWSYDGGEVSAGAVKRKQLSAGEMQNALLALAGEDQDVDDAPSGSETRDLEHWDELFDADACGTAEYRTTFDVSEAPARAMLDLGVVGVAAEATLNGTLVGTRIWSPYRIDVTGALKTGENELVVRVTSTIHRLMWSPDVTGDFETRGWLNTYARDVAKQGREPAPAGLLGPVTLDMWK